MKLHTASAVISFAKELESESANCYESLSQKYAKDEDVILSFAKENGKNIVQIERAYYGVITDAIEGCFAFSLSPHEYTLETGLADNESYSHALSQAIEMEDRIMRFYLDATEQSKPLMADVPRAFTMVAKKRDDRKARLRSLLNK